MDTRTNQSASSGGRAPNRPTFGLGAALAEIDRRFPSELARSYVRAAACYNYNDAESWHREMVRGLDVVADLYGLPHGEISRLILPPTKYLGRKGKAPSN